MNTATTPLEMDASNSIVVRNVTNFTTETVPVATIPIDSIGVKTVTVAHKMTLREML